MTIRSVPTTYRGVRFRSTLEADWALNLDLWQIVWQYEPEAVQLPSGDYYRPDFYLPGIATWLEVKGPHDERIGKAHELAKAVEIDPSCPANHDGSYYMCGCGEYQVVVIGRAPLGGMADWELLDPMGGAGEDCYLCPCSGCGEWWWVGMGAYGCRAHRRYEGGDGDLRAGYRAASDNLKPHNWGAKPIPFARVPRPVR